MDDITKAIHTPFRRRDAYDALQMPIYDCLAFEFDNAEVMSDAFCGRLEAPDYSRVLNPTVIHLEDIVKGITSASEVSAFTSGMAALSAMFFSVASSGKNIVTSCHVFGNTYLLLTDTLKRFGVDTIFVDMTDLDKVRSAVNADTCCIFMESVTNPQTEVADVRALSEIARSNGIPLIADTTVVPFTQFDGKSLGIDFQIVSSSKYISGGATSLGGIVIDYGNYPETGERIKKEMVFNLGSYMTPHAAYMQTLGMETLNVRFDRQSDTALRIASALQNADSVTRVDYPALASHPQHEIFTRLYGDKGGAMLTFDLESKEACFRFIDALELVHRATNLADNRTLAIHPESTIFGNLTEEQRAEMHIRPTMIRLSVGLEDADDILDDLLKAINKSKHK